MNNLHEFRKHCSVFFAVMVSLLSLNFLGTSRRCVASDLNLVASDSQKGTLLTYSVEQKSFIYAERIDDTYTLRKIPYDWEGTPTYLFKFPGDFNRYIISLVKKNPAPPKANGSRITRETYVFEIDKTGTQIENIKLLSGSEHTWLSRPISPNEIICSCFVDCPSPRALGEEDCFSCTNLIRLSLDFNGERYIDSRKIAESRSFCDLNAVFAFSDTTGTPILLNAVGEVDGWLSLPDLVYKELQLERDRPRNGVGIEGNQYVSVRFASFSDDMRYLAAVVQIEDYAKLRVWDCSSGKVVYRQIVSLGSRELTKMRTALECRFVAPSGFLFTIGTKAFGYNFLTDRESERNVMPWKSANNLATFRCDGNSGSFEFANVPMSEDPPLFNTTTMSVFSLKE